MPGDADQRKSIRVPVRFPAQLLKGQVQTPGLALNLSVGGIFIQLAKPLIPFETWEIQFVLPDEGKSLKMKARVVWTAHGRIQLYRSRCRISF